MHAPGKGARIRRYEGGRSIVSRREVHAFPADRKVDQAGFTDVTVSLSRSTVHSILVVVSPTLTLKR